MSRLIDHAHRELELLLPDANAEAALYGPSFIKAAIMPMIGVFAASGHSGGSAETVLPLLAKLLRGENLTPITDDAQDWVDMTAMGDPLSPMWQCRRNSSFISGDAGRTYWDVNEQTGNGIIRKFHISDNSQQPKEFYHQDPTYGFEDPCPIDEIYYGPGGFWHVLAAPDGQWSVANTHDNRPPFQLQDWHVSPDGMSWQLLTRQGEYLLQRPAHLVGQKFGGLTEQMPPYTLVINEVALRHFFRRVRNPTQTETGYNISAEMNPGLGQFINRIQTVR